AYLYLPGGGGVQGPPDPTSGDAGPGWGWGMLVLPYMEQTPLYEAFNVSVPCWSPQNAAPALTVIPSYVCPSSPRPSDTYPVVDGNGNTLAIFSRGNYVVSQGNYGAWSDPSPDLSYISNGVFYRNSR